MLKINLKTKPKHGAVIVPLAYKLPNLYSNRVAVISHMSGYPEAMYVIGRLQRLIDTSSYAALLKSCVKIRDIARVTGDVIDTMEGLKVDRYQLNRTDIMTYISSVTDTMRTYKPSPDELDLIAHLITSFESNMNSWMLQGGDPEDNLHIRFKNLYQEVMVNSEELELACYDPHDDTISSLGKLPQFKLTINEKKNASDANPDRIKDAAVLYRYAATRIIDHLYSLMMDKDVWYKFVSPRNKAEVGTNLERGKSLKTFALYIQNLLSYNQFFMLETFLYSYDLVQKWITYFPPLEATTLYKLDNVVRPHDLLNAKRDVQELLDSFTQSKQNLAQNLIVFPSEMLASMGLKKAVEQLNQESIKYANIDPMTDLKNLDRPVFLPLLSGASAGNFDIAYDLTNTLLLGKAVSDQIEKALIGLTPSLIRGSSNATVSALKEIGLSAKLDFKVPHSLEYSVERGVLKEIENGKLYLDSAAPQFSWKYHEFIRKDVTFMTITDDQIANKFGKFTAKQIVDRDRAAKYKSMFEYDYQTLVPSSWSTGNIVYKAATLKSDKDQVRLLIETLTHKNFDIAVRELGLPHIRKIWATYFSSFALLYIDDDVVNAFDRKTTPWKMPILVEGHGRPYGISYQALAGKQKPVKEQGDFVTVSEGIYLRILDTIPVVTDELTVDNKFYQEHPTLFFAANSATEPVEEFVVDSPLLNFALFPVVETPCVPPLVFTSKYAYLTKGLYLNIELFYRPSAPDTAREITDVSLTKKEWPYERHKFWLEYITFPNYAAKTSGIDIIMDEDETVKAAVEKIEKVMTADNKEAAASVDGTGSASSSGAKRIAQQFEKLGDTKEIADDRPAFMNPKKGDSNKSDNKTQTSKSNPKDVEKTMGAAEDEKGMG